MIPTEPPTGPRPQPMSRMASESSSWAHLKDRGRDQTLQREMLDARNTSSMAKGRTNFIIEANVTEYAVTTCESADSVKVTDRTTKQHGECSGVVRLIQPTV